MMRAWLGIVCWIVVSFVGYASAAEPFELRDGDRVALIGNTFVEREQSYSYLETFFVTHWPDRKITFRNLGWSGDTVWGDARGYEHDAARGFENLTKQVHELKPTVIFLGYGMGESFDGEAGLPRFREGLERMLEMLKDLDARIVILGPIRHEKLPPPLPDPAEHNASLRNYSDVLADVAAKRGHRFVDLFALLKSDDGSPLTDNGIHLTQRGYERAAATIAKALGLHSVSSSPASERVRQLAIQKNIQYFNQWRPANEPYIFGFRKHEQSRNQVELPRFSPAIERLEAQMRDAALGKPVKAVAHEPAVTQPTTDQSASTDPEVERKSFKIADGLDVNLFASDPQIAKPIQMNWDARGRLWVASSAQYPQIKPGEQPADRIVVLEDADGDGVAEKSSTFADGLLIPTGVQPDADGSGAFVANSTELLHLKDTDGDGRADQRRIVLSGFGTEDTHHIIHTFRRGIDARLYFNQSVYIHSHVETPHGVRRLAGGGIWRFSPATNDFDVFSRGMINGWGHSLDQWGQSFGADGAGDGGVYYVWPGSVFTWAVGFDRTLGGMNPGSPKYCGLAVVDGRHLPDDWQGNAITNDFRANRVVRYQLSDVDGAYVSKQMPDVITSTDVAFRPVDVSMGPDGAIYVADWYNPIINHGEVDFRDPRRDKTHGRIWRITAKGRKTVERPKLVDAPVADVLEALKSPENWTRQQAKLVLHQRGATEVLPSMDKWLAGLGADDDQRERHRLEALWTYLSLDTPNVKLLGELLEAKTPQVRAAATRVVGDWLGHLPNPTDLLAARVADEHARVRLEAVRALARVKSLRAIELAMRALDKPRDKDMDYALWLTARDSQSLWLPEMSAGRPAFDDSPAHATFALRAVKSAAAANVLTTMWRADRVPVGERDEVMRLVGEVGAAPEAKLAYDVATAADTPAELQLAALASLEQCAGRGAAPTGADPTKIAAMIKSSDEKTAVAAMKVAGLWKDVDARAALTAAAEASQTTPTVRRTAIAALADLGGGSAEFFRKLDAPHQSFDVRVAAIVGLASGDLADAAKRAVALLADAPTNSDPSTLLAGLLKRDGAGDALAGAMSGRRLPQPIAKAALKHVESTGRDEKKLLDVLRAAAGSSAIAAKKLSKDEMTKLVADVTRYGDAARGEAIFRRADTACFKCHAIQGAGGQLGPDLGSIGASSPLDYLIDSLLDPNKAIKDGYNSVIVKMKDGDVHSGIKVSQDAADMVLRDAITDRIPIKVVQIRSEKPGGSLMPTGLLDPLPSWEQTNLLRFLSELGKPGPFGPGDPMIVRRWRVLPADAAAKLVADPTPLKSLGSAAALPWTPAYTLVSGDLPADAVATAGQAVGFARAEIEVTSPGRVRLHVGEPKGLTIWVNDRAVDAVAGDVEADLPVGVHTVTLRIDLGERGQGLRLEVREAAGSTAAARPVGGR